MIGEEGGGGWGGQNLWPGHATFSLLINKLAMVRIRYFFFYVMNQASTLLQPITNIFEVFIKNIEIISRESQ